MNPVLTGTLILLSAALLTLWLKFQIRYRLGERRLRISVLGITLRRIPIADIERVSKRKRGLVENWSNVWRDKHKLVVLHRKGALRRPILITPPNRYIFIKELEAAQAKLGVQMAAAPEEDAAN